MRRAEMLESESELSKGRLGESGDCWEYGMLARGLVVTTLAGVGFCGILDRPQIIAYGNHRKQDDNEHDEANE